MAKQWFPKPHPLAADNPIFDEDGALVLEVQDFRVEDVATATAHTQKMVDVQAVMESGRGSFELHRSSWQSRAACKHWELLENPKTRCRMTVYALGPGGQSIALIIPAVRLTCAVSIVCPLGGAALGPRLKELAEQFRSDLVAHLTRRRVLMASTAVSPAFYRNGVNVATYNTLAPSHAQSAVIWFPVSSEGIMNELEAYIQCHLAKLWSGITQTAVELVESKLNGPKEPIAQAHAAYAKTLSRDPGATTKKWFLARQLVNIPRNRGATAAWKASRMIGQHTLPVWLHTPSDTRPLIPGIGLQRWITIPKGMYAAATHTTAIAEHVFLIARHAGIQPRLDTVVSVPAPPSVLSYDLEWLNTRGPDKDEAASQYYSNPLRDYRFPDGNDLPYCLSATLAHLAPDGTILQTQWRTWTLFGSTGHDHFTHCLVQLLKDGAPTVGRYRVPDIGGSPVVVVVHDSGDGIPLAEATRIARGHTEKQLRALMRHITLSLSNDSFTKSQVLDSFVDVMQPVLDTAAALLCTTAPPLLEPVVTRLKEAINRLDIFKSKTRQVLRSMHVTTDAKASLVQPTGLPAEWQNATIAQVCEWLAAARDACVDEFGRGIPGDLAEQLLHTKVPDGPLTVDVQLRFDHEHQTSSVACRSVHHVYRDQLQVKTPLECPKTVIADAQEWFQAFYDVLTLTPATALVGHNLSFEWSMLMRGQLKYFPNPTPRFPQSCPDLNGWLCAGGKMLGVIPTTTKGLGMWSKFDNETAAGVKLFSLKSVWKGAVNPVFVTTVDTVIKELYPNNVSANGMTLAAVASSVLGPDFQKVAEGFAGGAEVSKMCHAGGHDVIEFYCLIDTMLSLAVATKRKLLLETNTLAQLVQLSPFMCIGPGNAQAKQLSLMQTKVDQAVLGDVDTAHAGDTSQSSLKGGLVYHPRRQGEWFARDVYVPVPAACVAAGVKVRHGDTNTTVEQLLDGGAVLLATGETVPVDELQWMASELANYLDFASMYPSKICSNNVGPDTIVSPAQLEANPTIATKTYTVALIMHPKDMWEDPWSKGNMERTRGSPRALASCSSILQRLSPVKSREQCRVRIAELESQLLGCDSRDVENVKVELKRTRGQLAELASMVEMDVMLQSGEQRKSFIRLQIDNLLSLRKGARRRLKVFTARGSELKAERELIDCTVLHCGVCELPMTGSEECCQASCSHMYHVACSQDKSVCPVCLAGPIHPEPIDGLLDATMLSQLQQYQTRIDEAIMMQSVLELRQAKYKVMANSFYGVFGTTGVYFRNAWLGSLITAECRNDNLFCNRWLGADRWRGWQACLMEMAVFYSKEQQYGAEPCFASAKQSFETVVASSRSGSVEDAVALYQDKLCRQETFYGDTDSVVQYLPLEYFPPFVSNDDRLLYALALGVCQVTLLKESPHFSGTTMYLELEMILTQMMIPGNVRKRYVAQGVPDSRLGDFAKVRDWKNNQTSKFMGLDFVKRDCDMMRKEVLKWISTHTKDGPDAVLRYIRSTVVQMVHAANLPMLQCRGRGALPACSCTNADHRWGDPVQLARKQAIGDNAQVSAIIANQPKSMTEKLIQDKLVIGKVNVTATHVKVALKAQYLSRYFQMVPGMTQTWSAPFALATYTSQETGMKKLSTRGPVQSKLKTDPVKGTKRFEVHTNCKTATWCWDAKSQTDAALLLPEDDTLIPAIDYVFYLHATFANSVINQSFFIRQGFDGELARLFESGTVLLRRAVKSALHGKYTHVPLEECDALLLAEEAKRVPKQVKAEPRQPTLDGVVIKPAEALKHLVQASRQSIEVIDQMVQNSSARATYDALAGIMNRVGISQTAWLGTVVYELPSVQNPELAPRPSPPKPAHKAAKITQFYKSLPAPAQARASHPPKPAAPSVPIARKPAVLSSSSMPKPAGDGAPLERRWLAQRDRELGGSVIKGSSDDSDEELVMADSACGDEHPMPKASPAMPQPPPKAGMFHRTVVMPRPSSSKAMARKPQEQPKRKTASEDNGSDLDDFIEDDEDEVPKKRPKKRAKKKKNAFILVDDEAEEDNTPAQQAFDPKWERAKDTHSTQVSQRSRTFASIFKRYGSH